MFHFHSSSSTGETNSKLASRMVQLSLTLVSQRSWVRIPFKADIFSFLFFFFFFQAFSCLSCVHNCRAIILVFTSASGKKLVTVLLSLSVNFCFVASRNLMGVFMIFGILLEREGVNSINSKETQANPHIDNATFLGMNFFSEEKNKEMFQQVIESIKNVLDFLFTRSRTFTLLLIIRCKITMNWETLRKRNCYTTLIGSLVVRYECSPIRDPILFNTFAKCSHSFVRNQPNTLFMYDS